MVDVGTFNNHRVLLFYRAQLEVEVIMNGKTDESIDWYCSVIEDINSLYHEVYGLRAVDHEKWGILANEKKEVATNLIEGKRSDCKSRIEKLERDITSKIDSSTTDKTITRYIQIIKPKWHAMKKLVDRDRGEMVGEWGLTGYWFEMRDLRLSVRKIIDGKVLSII